MIFYKGQVGVIVNNQIAVLIPCYNEEQTVCEVVSAFRNHLPAAAVYVYYVDMFIFDDTALLHQLLVNGYAAHIVQFRLCYGSSVYFAFKYGYSHFQVLRVVFHKSAVKKLSISLVLPMYTAIARADSAP